MSAFDGHPELKLRARDLIAYTRFNEGGASREIVLGLSLAGLANEQTIGSEIFKVPAENRLMWLCDRWSKMPAMGTPLKRRLGSEVKISVSVNNEGTPPKISQSGGSGALLRSWVNKRVMCYNSSGNELRMIWIFGFDDGELTYFPDVLDSEKSWEVLLPFELDPSCFLLTGRQAAPSGSAAAIELVYTNFLSPATPVMGIREVQANRHKEAGNVPIQVRWNDGKVAGVNSARQNAVLTKLEATFNEEIPVFCNRPDFFYGSGINWMVGTLNETDFLGEQPGRYMMMPPDIAHINGTRRLYANFRFKLARTNESHHPVGVYTMEDGRSPANVVALPAWDGSDYQAMTQRAGLPAGTNQWESNGMMRANVYDYHNFNSFLWGCATFDDRAEDGPFLWENKDYMTKIGDVPPPPE